MLNGVETALLEWQGMGAMGAIMLLKIQVLLHDSLKAVQTV